MMLMSKAWHEGTQSCHKGWPLPLRVRVASHHGGGASSSSFAWWWHAIEASIIHRSARDRGANAAERKSLDRMIKELNERARRPATVHRVKWLAVLLEARLKESAPPRWRLR